MKIIRKVRKIYGSNNDSKIFFRTFGDFDLFIDGKAIPISNAKCKELLALLVDKLRSNCYPLLLTDS